MKRLGLLRSVVLMSVAVTPLVSASASEEIPGTCHKLVPTQDYEANYFIKQCLKHVEGDNATADMMFGLGRAYHVQGKWLASMSWISNAALRGSAKAESYLEDPANFDHIYRLALQHQNGIRDNREMALQYYELLLRDQNRDWRIIVSNRVDEYAVGVTSLGYPYRSKTQILADIKEKYEDFKREVDGKNRIPVGETGTIEIPEHLSIGQKFVAIIGAAIIADIARGLSGDSLPQEVQEVHDRFNKHQRDIQEQEFSTWATGAAASYLP